jgi:rhamnogalacturonan endolyase
VNYTIGASDWRTDWDYTQFGSSPWNVHFNLSATPSADAAISLYLALASSETTLMVSVNDHKVATYKAPQPAHAAVRLGSHGPFSETRIAIPAGLLRRGENTIAIVQLLAKDKQGTTQYDYLRLEADGVQLVQPVAHLPASAAATRASSQ